MAPTNVNEWALKVPCVYCNEPQGNPCVARNYRGGPNRKIKYLHSDRKAAGFALARLFKGADPKPTPMCGCAVCLSDVLGVCLYKTRP